MYSWLMKWFLMCDSKFTNYELNNLYYHFSYVCVGSFISWCLSFLDNTTTPARLLKRCGGQRKIWLAKGKLRTNLNRYLPGMFRRRFTESILKRSYLLKSLEFPGVINHPQPRVKKIITIGRWVWHVSVTWASNTRKTLDKIRHIIQTFGRL